MQMADLILTLRTDLADSDSRAFSDETLARCLGKAVFRLNRDLSCQFTVANGMISPEPVGETRELLVLLGQIHACQVMRSATAGNFSFSSGDKRVDKTMQPTNWAKLEEDLTVLYRARLAEIRPSLSENTEDYMIQPEMRPVIFEHGSKSCR